MNELHSLVSLIEEFPVRTITPSTKKVQQQQQIDRANLLF